LKSDYPNRGSLCFSLVPDSTELVPQNREREKKHLLFIIIFPYGMTL